MTGNIRINSSPLAPIGIAPSYTVRAWVSFNGAVSPIPLTGGNVSSISDGGVGTYTINFTTALPHANYCTVSMAKSPDGLISDVSIDPTTNPTVNACKIVVRQFAGEPKDSSIVNFAAII